MDGSIDRQQLDHYAQRRLDQLDAALARQKLRDQREREAGRKPLGPILALIPGGSIIEQARNACVSRTTFDNWLAGRSRPAGDNAARVSALTGVPVEDIVGPRGHFTPTGGKKTARKRRR